MIIAIVALTVFLSTAVLTYQFTDWLIARRAAKDTGIFKELAERRKVKNEWPN